MGERDKHPQPCLEYRMTRQPTETRARASLASFTILIRDNQADASKGLEPKPGLPPGAAGLGSSPSSPHFPHVDYKWGPAECHPEAPRFPV